MSQKLLFKSGIFIFYTLSGWVHDPAAESLLNASDPFEEELEIGLSRAQASSRE